jgi:TonB family protein
LGTGDEEVIRVLQIALTLFLVALSYNSSVAQGQEAVRQQPNLPQAQGETNQPKSEIDEALAELKKRGEPIIRLCKNKCTDANRVINDIVIKEHTTDLVTPTYPAIARSAHAAGQVGVLVIIDKDGKVKAAEIIEGHPLLRAAAVKAAKASKFTPTLLEGKPVAILGEIIYNFVAVR